MHSHQKEREEQEQEAGGEGGAGAGGRRRGGSKRRGGQGGQEGRGSRKEGGGGRRRREKQVEENLVEKARGLSESQRNSEEVTQFKKCTVKTENGFHRQTSWGSSTTNMSTDSLSVKEA